MAAKSKAKRRAAPKTRRIVDVLTLEEIWQLARRCSRKASTGVRNRALLALLYGGALRIGEVLALAPADFDRATGDVSVRAGKGGAARTVALDPDAAEWVQKWIERRNERRMRAPTLICTLAGAPVKQQYVNALLKRLAREAGIKKRIHPHALRHSRALHLNAQGKRVDVVQAQLGHKDLRTTTRYLAHVTREDLREAAAAVPWIQPERGRRPRTRGAIARPIATDKQTGV